MHMRQLILAKPLFLCKYCNKKFTALSDLKQHEMIHNGEKPFICTICDKNYTPKQLHTDL